jgi:pimeloyl-ACP methyl ester carboxylesterase
MKCRLKDITVHYVTRGAGRPMVMLHGFTLDHRVMLGCMEPLFTDREGWQRIYLDLPGMGRTLARPWVTGSDQMLGVVLDFIDATIPGQHFVAAGESYGGYLARGLVYRRPDMVDGLLLICPMVVADRARRTLPKPTVLVRDSRLLKSLNPAEAREFESVAVIQTRANWKRFAREVLAGIRICDEAFVTKLQAHGYSFSFDVDNLSTAFEKPSLILTGRQDSSVGYADAWTLLERYPRATLAVLDRAGHNLQIEQEAQFNMLVKDWLTRLEE